MISGIVASQATGVAGVGSTTYATWDPAQKDASIALSGGDLIATKGGGDALKSVRSTLGVSAGKHYWEILANQCAWGPYMLLGVGTSGVSLASFVGNNASGWGYYEETGQKDTNNVLSAYGDSWQVDNTRIGIAIDMGAGKVWFSKNGVWQASGDPAAGTNAAFTGLAGTIYAYASLYTGGQSASLNHKITANFGASALTYTPPSGFNAGLYV